jgi:GNAT superfamily N-acetyltransferase
MSAETRVMRADAPQRTELEATGWAVVARSWGAELDLAEIDRARLDGLVSRATDVGSVRALVPDDVDLILELDATTVGDYPGSVATRHTQLDRDRATPTAGRRACGFFTSEDVLAAMTFAEVDGTDAEIDFTVVARAWRGQGIGTAIKAASVLNMFDLGIRRIRTGGSADNAPIIAANTTLGFVIDEHWVTLQSAR